MLRDLQGGDAAENARLGLQLLDGEAGPRRDLVCLNAAAALIVAGLADDLADGLEIAEAAIDDGNARAALDRLVATSNVAAQAGARLSGAAVRSAGLGVPGLRESSAALSKIDLARRNGRRGLV